MSAHTNPPDNEKECEFMQLIGTGKDARFPDGQAFDVPEAQSQYAEQLLSDGLATKPAPGTSNDRRTVEVANAMVRGDALTNPDDRAVVGKIEGSKTTPHDIVHTNDPKAKAGAHELSQDEAAERAPAVEEIGTAKDTPQTAAARATGAEAKK